MQPEAYETKKENKCEYCDKPATQERNVIVDSEPNVEDGGTVAVYGRIWVCDSCAEAIDDGNLDEQYDVE